MISSSDLELRAVHKDRRHVSGFELLRRDKRLHDHEPTSLRVSAHAPDGLRERGGGSAVGELHQDGRGDPASIRRAPAIGECLGECDVAQHTAIADVGSPGGTEAPFEEYGQAVPG